MQDKTRQDYLKLAEYFLVTRFAGKSITPKAITDALIYCASEYRPAYWRRLRKALELHQRELGFIKSAERIASTHNPVTKPDSSGKQSQKSKPKQKLVKSVSEADYQKLIQHLRDAGDSECFAAVVIANLLGCRPAEMPHLRFLAENTIYIPSAKQTEERGLDRKLRVSNKTYEILKNVHTCLLHQDKGVTSDMARIQRRLQRHVKMLWPQRKAQLSLYSFRHQMGSNLKASGLDNVDAAAIMGHQSVSSLDIYGNRRQGRSHINITPTVETTSQVRRKVMSVSGYRRFLDLNLEELNGRNKPVN